MKTAFLASLFLGGASASSDSIFDIVAGSPDHTVLAALLNGSSLTPNFQSVDTEATVFAPTDAAFATLNATLNGTLGDLTRAEKDVLITLHALGGKVMAADVPTDPKFFVKTLQGLPLQGMNDAGNITLGWTDMGSVTVTDLQTSNNKSVVHVVDGVFGPVPENVADAATTANLTTLLAAVLKAELADTLLELEDVTIFAPSNQAFSDAGIDLDTIDKDALANVLKYHVYAGRAWSTALTDGQMVETVQGQSVEVGINGATVTIGGATVLIPDYPVANGAVHVIDAVLMPQAMTTGAPDGNATTQMPMPGNTTEDPAGSSATKVGFSFAALVLAAAFY